MSKRAIKKRATYKKMVSFLWKWGVAIAILGIVFLINSWTSGTLITSIGGFILILAYILSSFKRVQHEYDWTLVYPELAGIGDEGIDDYTPISEKEILQKEIEQLKDRLEALKHK